MGKLTSVEFQGDADVKEADAVLTEWTFAVKSSVRLGVHERFCNFHALVIHGNYRVSRSLVVPVEILKIVHHFVHFWWIFF